jgi:hypothetical protein
MGRKYTVNLSPTAFTVATDLAELTPADDIPIAILGFRVWQTTELGDAAEEEITLSWIRGHTTSGTGGSAATPVLKDHRDAAAAVTAEVGNTSAASAGTTTVAYSTGWNVRAPLEVTFTPEQQIRSDQGNTTLVLRMGAAPADSTTIGCSVDVEEL